MNIDDYFVVYFQEDLEDGKRYFVIPKRDFGEIEQFLHALSLDYKVRFFRKYGEFVLELRRRKENVAPNIALIVATVITTTIAGSLMYPDFNILGGLAFSAAIMFVLGSHELGHYLAAKRWKMRVSLPYFIPFPSILGTLGAVIKHEGPIPSRKALFDVGVSGPIAGILASIFVAFIGLQIPYEVQAEEKIILGVPPLFEILISISHFEGEFIHPVAFAGWVGLFVTFFNMLPAGQLDGGHITRAMIGEKSEYLSKSIPIVLLALGFILKSNFLMLWSIIVFLFAMQRHPKPINDAPIDKKRYILGVLAFVLSALCFTPMPFSVNYLT